MCCYTEIVRHFTGVVSHGCCYRTGAPPEFSYGGVPLHPTPVCTGVCRGREWSELVLFGAWLSSRTSTWSQCGTLLQGVSPPDLMKGS